MKWLLGVVLLFLVVIVIAANTNQAQADSIFRRLGQTEDG
jgi:hypothetical protein